MKKMLLFIAIFITCFTVLFATTTQQAQARSYRTKSSDVYVKGYTKKNGTYVQPYYRSKSDGVKYNNYSCLDYGKSLSAYLYFVLK
jgi:hypothetical protein